MRRATRVWALSLPGFLAGARIVLGLATPTSGCGSGAGIAGPEAAADPGPSRRAGQVADLGATFEARAIDGRVEVDLTFARKRATVRWASSRSFEVRVSPATGPSNACTILLAEEEGILRELAARWQREGSRDTLSLYLLGTVNVLVDWPQGLPVCLSREGDQFSMMLPNGQAVSARSEGSESLPGVDICGRLGLPNRGRYPTAVGSSFTPTQFVEAVRVVGSERCRGRCGRGCLGDGFPGGFNVYTQSCFNHDLCVEDLGLFGVPCFFLLPDVVADTLVFFRFPCDAPPGGLP